MFVMLDVVRDGRLAWLSMQLNLTPVITVDHPLMLCMFVHDETFYSAHNSDYTGALPITARLKRPIIN